VTAGSPTRWTIRSGGSEAVIGRRGAGLCAYTVDGVDVTDPLGEQEVPEAYQGLVLAPWPNRVPDGRWSWAGQELQLPVNEVPTGCALHGLVAWTAWSPRAVTEDAVELGVAIEPQPGYPFALDLTVRWSVAADGLRCRIGVQNTGWTAAPFGVAVHPYVVLPGCTVDDLELTLPAASWLETDERLRPVGLATTSGTARRCAAAGWTPRSPTSRAPRCRSRAAGAPSRSGRTTPSAGGRSTPPTTSRPTPRGTAGGWRWRR
jgi:aldose 1-epimerase